MGALRFVGLAIVTAVAPITPIMVLIGSSPAHAQPTAGQPCMPDEEGHLAIVKVLGANHELECAHVHGQFLWMDNTEVCGQLPACHPNWRGTG
jgi:hypothetical protein